ncbi:MAG: MarP family serine protease [Actinomycetota bacterium]|nr:MarP family serine protease [Actinomycetota bacterium]
MNWVDLLLVVIIVAWAVHGVWLGAAIQVLSFGGVIGGLALGSAIAPAVARLTPDQVMRLFLSLAVVFLSAAVLGGIGRQIGVRLWGALRSLRLSRIDAAGGAVVAAIAALLSSWLVASMFATASLREMAAPIQNSVILRTVDEVMPPAPSVFAPVQALVGLGKLPPAFAGLEPQPTGPLPAPPEPVVRAALARAADATVKITGTGCGGISEGSGFVAAPGLVITNAHVVAGIDQPNVIQDGRRSRATPVLFDPQLDLAVLRVSGRTVSPLPLVPTEVARGTAGAIVGYPEGRPLDAEPAVVLRQIEAVGRDIYSEALTRRRVYQLRTRVLPGNSGGPAVDAAGSVFGVVFSRSAAQDDVGYALTSDAVLPRLEEARGRQARVDTGPCVL